MGVNFQADIGKSPCATLWALSFCLSNYGRGP